MFAVWKLRCSKGAEDQLVRTINLQVRHLVKASTRWTRLSPLRRSSESIEAWYANSSGQRTKQRRQPTVLRRGQKMQAAVQATLLTLAP